ncbi:hypothetical protein PMALA_023220 [Plasmodium malariae]|uniref:Uncharacterized protein n=1 Tax=Plasmodium malariae TaxID=5858 RepID=A0A1A8WA70_PLAMA|nr:hypothetical protein PMALA_023220 [Plasmodium malariae]
MKFLLHFFDECYTSNSFDKKTVRTIICGKDDIKVFHAHNIIFLRNKCDSHVRLARLRPQGDYNNKEKTSNYEKTSLI